MKKDRNFIARLFQRNNPDACAPIDSASDGMTGSEPEAEVASGTEAEKAKGGATPETAGPTICKGGKLFRARLRNGRWETVGAPIGVC